MLWYACSEDFASGITHDEEPRGADEVCHEHSTQTPLMEYRFDESVQQWTGPPILTRQDLSPVTCYSLFAWLPAFCCAMLRSHSLSCLFEGDL